MKPDLVAMCSRCQWLAVCKEYRTKDGRQFRICQSCAGAAPSVGRKPAGVVVLAKRRKTA